MYNTNPILFEALLRKTASGAFGLECPPPENLPAKGFVYENGILYFERFWTKKQHLVALVNDRNQLKIAQLKKPFAVDERLNPAQKEALLDIFSSHTLLLQGGPGSGKTFTISRLIPLFLEALPGARILVAAQTAKAVHHLANQLDPSIRQHIQVRTIHKLLKISPDIRPPALTYIDYDLVIVDESSMLDIDLMCLFLESVSPTTRLLFVGDPQQLPPIEGGAPFKYLIETKPFPHHFLPGSHRAENRALIDAANALFFGEEPETLPLDLFSIEASLDYFPKPTNELPKSFPPLRYKILSSLRIGPHGSKEISAKIFNQLYDQFKGQKERYMIVPIMITQNNEKLSLFNGQEGVYVLDKKSPQRQAYFAHLPHPMPLALLPPHEISYAISIHKSQGSEYDHVDVLLPESKEPLLTEHLYTAMTRAKKICRLFQ